MNIDTVGTILIWTTELIILALIISLSLAKYKLNRSFISKDERLELNKLLMGLFGGGSFLLVCGGAVLFYNAVRHTVRGVESVWWGVAGFVSVLGFAFFIIVWWADYRNKVRHPANMPEVNVTPSQLSTGSSRS